MTDYPSTTGRFRLPPIAIIAILFFVFGFISWINAVLIPYFKIACELSDRESMLVAFAFYISYFIMAIPSSGILKVTGFKNGMIAGLLCMCVGALIFIPAALNRAYPLFLGGLFVQATGLTLLQTACNPYVTILGPIESAARRISLMGICNKIAGSIAPLLLIHYITKSPDEIDQIKSLLPSMAAGERTAILNELSSRLVAPYIVIALTLALLALLIRKSKLPEIEEAEEPGFSSGVLEKKKTIFQYPHLILGAVAVFCIVSAEVLAVDSIINYALHENYVFREAKFFATYTLLFMIIAYLAGIAVIPRFISQRKMLSAAAASGLFIIVLVLLIPGKTSVWLIAFLGLSNALLWPTIWPLALSGLGQLTKKGSALLIMGIMGGAIMPLLYGMASDRLDPRKAFAVLLPCYIFILYYGLKGYRAGKPPVTVAD